MEPWNITVNQPPIVNITYPANNQTVNGTIIITGAANDTDGIVQKVEVRIDTGNWSLATGTTYWSFVWNTTTVSNGWHTIYARAYDGIDYSEIKSVSVYVDNAILDTVPPQISNVQAVPSTQIPGGYVNITCSVTDNVAVNVVAINMTGPEGFTLVCVPMTRIPGSGNYYYNTTYSTEGTYNYLIWANDTSNNRNISGDYQFVIQAVNQPPIVNITYPTESQTVNGTITITGTASDSDAIKKNEVPNGTTVQFVEIKIDNGSWQLATGTTTWSFTWNTTTVSNGWHTIYARAYDGIDYSEIKSVSVYVDNLILKAIISSPKEGDAYLTTDSIYFDGANSTSIINLPPTYYWISNISGSIGNTSQFYAGLPAGNHLITLFVSVENLTDYATVSITVIAPNQPPTATIDSITPNPAISGQSVTFTGYGTDLDGNITAYNWRSSIDGQLSISASFSISTLSVGTHTIYFKVRDNNGAWSDEVTETLVINLNVPPTVNITYPGDSQTVNGVVTITGSASDSDGTVQKVEVKIDDGGWQLASGTTSWSFIWNTTTFSDGLHTIYARSYDGFNYSETKSVQVNVYNIVNQPPVAEFVFYQGMDVADGDEVNVTLRVSGEKYRFVNLSVYEDDTKICSISLERELGAPETDYRIITIDSSKLYTIVIDYTADKKGGNSVWMAVDYGGIAYEEHMVFHETSTEEFNLTTILDVMIRSARMLRFDASGSDDPDGIITNYTFDFGDGCLGYEKVVVHTYDDYGTYTVSLSVMDNSGDTGFVSKVVDVLDVTGYYAACKGLVGVRLDCPADLTITDGFGRIIGYNNVNMRFENWIPNASMILFGDIEIYFIPRDADYAYRVSGNGEGEYVFSVFDPGEYGPGEYGPGEYGPGEYGPGEYVGKVYSIDSTVSNGSVDDFVVDDGMVSVSSSDDKYYSLYVKHGGEMFSLEDVHISGGIIHNYTVINWSALSSTDISSVRLEMFNGSVLEAVQEICSGLFGYDLLKPDLVIVNITIVGSLKEGEIVSFSVEVLNKAVVTPASLGVARDVYVKLYVDDEYIGSSSHISLIYSNHTAYTSVQWRVKPGNHTLRFVVYTADDIDSSNNEYSMNVNIEGKKPLIVITPEAAAVVVGTGACAAVLLFALVGTEIGKYKLFTFLAPLYLKTKKEEVLDNFIRGQIYGYIKANPGDHYNSIKRALDIDNGVFTYHLNVLEREGLIKSRRSGMYRCFYPIAAKIPEENGSGLNETQLLIVEKIKETPGISQKDIASLLGVSPSTIDYHIRKLISTNIVRSERIGMRIKYYLKENV
jgi:predicted transcriptional regulator